MKETNIKNKVGQNLLELRKEKGLKQDDVAQAVGITRASLSYYEKGERSVDIEVLYKLCQFYNISIDYLFGLSKVKTPDIDIKAMATKTGLSEKSINVLQTEKSLNHLYIVDVINILLNDCWTHPESRNTKYSFIDLFTNYLNFCANGGHKYSLSKSGNIKIDPKPDMIDIDGKAKYSKADIHFTSEQLEKMFIMEIEDVLKALKESYMIKKTKAPDTD